MANPIFKLLGSNTEIDDATRVVTVICSTETPDRIGDVVVQSGIDLTNYRTNPVVLWSHDSDMPVARASTIGVQDGVLRSTVQFPALGEDKDADWVYGKIKNRLVNAVSIGFVPLSYEAVDPKEPWDGYRFLECELVEFSFCTVPMNAEALIVGRSLQPPPMREKPPSKAMDGGDPPDPGITDDGTKWVCQACNEKNAADKTVCESCGAAMPVKPDVEDEDPGNKALGVDIAITWLEGFAQAIATPKAGRVISQANEERLRAAHTQIGAVLDQISTPPETEEQSLEEVRPTRVDVEGRSDTTRFPRRAIREVELLKMRSA